MLSHVLNFLTGMSGSIAFYLIVTQYGLVSEWIARVWLGCLLIGLQQLKFPPLVQSSELLVSYLLKFCTINFEALEVIAENVGGKREARLDIDAQDESSETLPAISKR